MQFAVHLAVGGVKGKVSLLNLVEGIQMDLEISVIDKTAMYTQSMLFGSRRLGNLCDGWVGWSGKLLWQVEQVTIEETLSNLEVHLVYSRNAPGNVFAEHWR
jgi:hypothetical protein